MQFGNVYGAGATDPSGVVRRALEARLGDQDFDTLVGMGLSGALVIPALASALGVKWAIVRKDGEGSHSSHKIEGSIGKRWVFVDDLISSGRTFTRVYKVVTHAFSRRYDDYEVRPDHETAFAGAYLYQGLGHWVSLRDAANGSLGYQSREVLASAGLDALALRDTLDTLDSLVYGVWTSPLASPAPF